MVRRLGSTSTLLWTAVLVLVGLLGHSIYACSEDERTASVRFNVASDRLYLEGEGCITPSQIYAQKLSSTNDSENFFIPIKAITKAGDESVDETGYWIFTSDVYVYNGVKLELHEDSGTAALRLKSEKGANESEIVELRAHGGWLSMLNTEVSSWDESVGDYQSFKNSSTPRSYITAISEMMEDPPETCLGHAKNNRGEARMDIINSEVHHLGYHGTEAYGVTFKVRGFCADLSNEHIFETVNVRGDIRFSNLHHNHFGMYSYGHQDGLWEYNLMHDNTAYGFDPHDDSDNLRIHNNVVYNNGNHGIIASKRCNDVSIQNNIIYDNNNAGIMLHRSSDGAIVRNNTISGSADACVAIFESMEGDYSNNTCIDNKYGFRWSVGASYNKIYDNYIESSSQYGLYFYEGSDRPYVTDGKPKYNIIANNVIDTAIEGLKMSDTVGNEFRDNVFTNTPDLRMRSSLDVIWQDNTIPQVVDIQVDAFSCVTEESDLEQLESGTEDGTVPVCE